VASWEWVAARGDKDSGDGGGPERMVIVLERRSGRIETAEGAASVNKERAQEPMGGMKRKAMITLVRDRHAVLAAHTAATGRVTTMSGIEWNLCVPDSVLAAAPERGPG